MALKSLILFLSLVAWTQAQAEEFAPTLALKAGKVRGLVTHFEHHKVNFYQGIRYGTAKRFAAPEPAPAWEGVYDATRMRFACPQQGIPISATLPEAANQTASNEDCLFLNIWQPQEDSPVDKKSRSVMVWIHGGGFIGGTIFSDFHDGRYLAVSGDVVVVSINYRLGALGFLTGDFEGAPGNQGLRDQILALQWVQENIHHFGGDPKKVTIFGESAGSMSVGVLVLSPLAAGLFHRAIMQSGAPNAYLGSGAKDKALMKTVTYAGKFNCPESSYIGLVACLRNKTLEQIMSKDGISSVLNGESFIPVYGDGAVLPENPVSALKSGKFNKVDLIFGLTSGEGAGFLAPFIPDLNPSNDGHEMSVAKANTMIGFIFQLFHEPYFQEVADFYTKGLNESDKNELRRIVTQTFGDYHLTCPTVLFGQEMGRHAPSARFYSYRLTHQTRNGCHDWMGACHAEDDQYLFASPMKHLHSYSAEDYQLAVDMVHAWAQFAKTGSPGPMEEETSNDEIQIEWKEAFAQDRTNPSVQFMTLDPKSYKMVSGFYTKVCDNFWKAKIFV